MSESGSEFRGTAENGIELSQETELTLVNAYKTGDESACNRLVYLYTPLVRSIATRVGKKYGVDPDDLYQEGVVWGLLKAAASFDAEMDCKLCTYAYRVIARTVIKYARRNAQLVRGLQRVDKDESGDSMAVADLPTPETWAEYERQEVVEKLRECILVALPSLTSAERTVAKLVLGLAPNRRMWKHQQIAKRAGKSRSRVSQVWESARRKLLARNEIRQIAQLLGYTCFVEPKKRGKACRRMALLGMKSR